MSKAEPSFLRARALRAKALAAEAAAPAARAPDLPPAPKAARPSAPNQTNAPTKQHAAPAAPTSPKATRRAKKRQGNLTGQGAEGGAQQSVADAVAAPLIEMMTSYAARPEIVRMLPGQTFPDAIAALVQGASVSGPHGAADRSMLFRMCGMPWMRQEGTGAAMLAGVQLGARLGTAVARLEGAGRHAGVTLDSAEAREVAESLRDLGGALLFEEQEAGAGQAGRQGAQVGAEVAGQVEGEAEASADAGQPSPPATDDATD